MDKEIKKRPSTEEGPKCIVCSLKADYELENGDFICDNCAQIMGELSQID